MAFSERSFIRQLQKFPTRPPVDVGIGDDGAVIDCSSGSKQIVVTDMLIDQVHFDTSSDDGYDIGYKCVAVNLSDLAAMASVPTAAFLSLALPKQLTADTTFLDEFYRAIEDLAQKYQFTIAGGDTNRIDGPLVVNVCLTGVPIGKQAVLRSGAKPGDLLVVTGPLGGSFPSGRHLKPSPRFDAAEWGINNLKLDAMMDISDGLSLDLHRMMEASGTGALLFQEQVPVHQDVSSTLADTVRISHALSDGEDFELLMAVDPDSFPTAFPKELNFTIVGRVTEQSHGIQQVSAKGDITELPETGFQHL